LKRLKSLARTHGKSNDMPITDPRTSAMTVTSLPPETTESSSSTLNSTQDPAKQETKSSSSSSFLSNLTDFFLIIQPIVLSLPSISNTNTSSSSSHHHSDNSSGGSISKYFGYLVIGDFPGFQIHSSNFSQTVQLMDSQDPHHSDFMMNWMSKTSNRVLETIVLDILDECVVKRAAVLREIPIHDSEDLNREKNFL